MSSRKPVQGAPSIEGYSGLEFIGRGGFSQVFRAEQEALGREVALKVLNFNTSNDRERRAFERECRAMGAVSHHPNIVTVYLPAYTDNGQPCIVMEYYSGGTLGDLAKNHGVIPVADVLKTGIKLASALAAAHTAGLTHRDIKPQNLFVSAYGEPALGDFGISAFNDEMTVTGAGGMTMHYAPPEAIESEAFDERSDVYSLAASLYTVAAGRRPFDRQDGESQTFSQIATRVLDTEAPVLGESNELRGLDQVLRRAMRKSRGERTASAQAFGEELQTLQRKLGLEVTSLSMIDTAAAPKPAAEIERSANDQLTATVARPRQPVVDTAEEGNQASVKRVAVGAVVGIAAIGAFVIAATVFSNRSGTSLIDEPVGTTTIQVVDQPDVLLSPSEPTNVSLEITDEGLLVKWESDEEGVIFDVLDVNSSFEPVQTEETSVLIAEIAEEIQPCVRLQASTPRGAISDLTPVVCLG